MESGAFQEKKRFISRFPLAWKFLFCLLSRDRFCSLKALLWCDKWNSKTEVFLSEGCHYIPKRLLPRCSLCFLHFNLGQHWKNISIFILFWWNGWSDRTKTAFDAWYSHLGIFKSAGATKLFKLAKLLFASTWQMAFSWVDKHKLNSKTLMSWTDFFEQESIKTTHVLCVCVLVTSW